MKHLKPLHLLFALVVMCGLFFNISTITLSFRPSTFKGLDILLDIVDKPQWRIGYSFTIDYPENFRKKEAEVKEMIIKSMQIWLQPLRERYPERQFTNDFSLVRMPDTEGCQMEEFSRVFGDRIGKVDLGIILSRRQHKEFSHAWVYTGTPWVCMKEIPVVEKGAKIQENFFFILVHEVGHTFGLEDTYAKGARVSTGGFSRTAGRQPSSMMSGSKWLARPVQIGEDDKNGIIWLYKYLYEDHPPNDCFFPDYVWVEHKFYGGCEPKYPLIFQVKHGSFESVKLILQDDPTLTINAQDHEGMTALHHAVARLDQKMVKFLMERQGIKVNLTNKYGQTPAQLAMKLHQRHLVKMIEAHPSSKWPLIAWDVSPKGKLTTTWGHLKKKY